MNLVIMDNEFLLELESSSGRRIENNFECDQILKTYSKKGYTLDEYFLVFLLFVNNKKVKYNIKNESSFIDFNLKRVLRDYPKMMITSYESKYNLKGLIPFAEIYEGYMVVLKDKENSVYGIYDNLVLLFGYSLIEGVENILKNKELKKLF